MVQDFHEILFPVSVALLGSGGPERKTDVIMTGSGYEERIARWERSRRRYDAGSGVKSFAELNEILTFFEERRGRLYGFRWRDRIDFSSCSFLTTPTAFDQILGRGDGAATQFQLIKKYGSDFTPYLRIIQKPVVGSVRLAIEGIEKSSATDFVVDHRTGLVSFNDPPARGAAITAGFLFDVPVRFDTDSLQIDFSAFAAGEIPKIPLVEIQV
ncbi:MAG: DUF2460 domain-containing protein [Alphaproteobacteria bacterium]